MIIKFEKISYDQFYKDCYPILERLDLNKVLSNELLNGINSMDELTKMLYDNIKIPHRKTSGSAGYDIYAAIPRYISKTGTPIINDNDKNPHMIPTGIKISMPENMVAKIYNRSSNCKKKIMLANNVAIIDSDYYNNPGNEGHCWLPFFVFEDPGYNFQAGEAYGQVIFEKYYTTDDDDFIEKQERVGGFGSTDN